MIAIDDQRELEDLQNRYVHAIDRGNLPLLRSLYTDDATEHHGEYHGPVDGFIDWLEPVLVAFDIATHSITNLLARSDGETAQSEARGIAFLRLKGPPPRGLIVINRHFDQYRKVAGRWLFARRSVCVDWAEQFPARESALDLVGSFAPGSCGSDDPVHREVPTLLSALYGEAGLR